MAQIHQSKKDWIQTYASRILNTYMKWQSPLGISETYSEHVTRYLEKYFDDPLKRALIEKTYQ